MDRQVEERPENAHGGYANGDNGDIYGAMPKI